MARPRKHSSKSKKNYTKEELLEKQQAEEGLKDFEQLDTSSVPYALRGDTIAVTEWRRIIPLLQELPIAELDLYAVVQYCKYIAIFTRASKDVHKNGTVIDGKKNPSYDVMLSSTKEIRAISNSLGLTIDSRLKLVVPTKEIKDIDPFADIESI